MYKTVECLNSIQFAWIVKIKRRNYQKQLMAVNVMPIKNIYIYTSILTRVCYYSNTLYLMPIILAFIEMIYSSHKIGIT